MGRGQRTGASVSQSRHGSPNIKQMISDELDLLLELAPHLSEDQQREKSEAWREKASQLIQSGAITKIEIDDLVADRQRAVANQVDNNPRVHYQLSASGDANANVAAEVRKIAFTDPDFKELEVKVNEYDLPKRFLQSRKSQVLIEIIGPQDKADILYKTIQLAISDYNRRVGA
jgi:hypothetical protein